MKDILFALLVAMGATLRPSAAATADSSIEFGRFGNVVVYAAAQSPRSVALFLSGDGGWNQGVVDMARSLADQGALVAGIDFPRYLRALEAAAEPCAYPAGDLEQLSHYLQAQYGFDRYLRPALVGYSSGATAVYATLVQAPVGTFAGGLMLGFCPDLPIRKPWCRGSGLASVPRKGAAGVDFLASRHDAGPMIILQGGIDQVCDAEETRKFAADVPGARVELLPKVGHGYSVERNWMPQYLAAWRSLSAEAPPAERPAPVSDLPLTEVAATGDSGQLAVMLSGDGGWAGLDQVVAKLLAARGVEVIGWDSLNYFWKPRTPDGGAADLARILRHYMEATGRRSVLLIGYSQGADTLPFMVNRLPADLRAQVQRVVLIGPGRSATFEFHVSTWLGKDPPGLPTGPEVARLDASRLSCLYGADETESLCRDLDRRTSRVVELKGGHHFGGDYEAVAESILADLPRR